MCTQEVSREEIELVGPILQKIARSGRAIMEEIQKYGVNIVPIDFYSNTPSIEDITTSFEYAKKEPPYLNESVFHKAVMTEVLAELRGYSCEFDPSVDGNEERCEGFFWKNSMFSYSDAMAYYCFIRRLKPKTILEIGSGFSTLVAIEAVERNGIGRIICVEPFPRAFLERNTNLDLRREKAQDLHPDLVNQMLQDGDVLFIDSTHTVKTGSDCLHLYLRLLPRIRRNIYVHVHDVFLPFGMPIYWLLDWRFFWTEQYLLLALITDNPRAKVLYGSTYHWAFNREALEQMMHNRYPSGGGSFWFEYRGRSEISEK